MKLSAVENDLILEIINIALAKAGDSLAFFTGEKVMMTSLNYKIEEINENTVFSNKKGNEIALLYTEIRGDIGGHCFLNFNKHEVEKLASIALPPSILDNPEKVAEMSKAILLEVDNIVTASVVTQFANLLSIRMLGYVPNIDVLNEQEVIQTIKSKANSKQIIINFKTTYLTEKNKIEPEFVWIMEKEFIQKIVDFSKKEENVVLINKMMIELNKE